MLQPFSNRTEVVGIWGSNWIPQRQQLAGVSLQSNRGIRQSGEKWHSKGKQNERKRRWNKIPLLICIEDELLSNHCSCKWKPCQRSVTSKGKQVCFLAFYRECVWLQKATVAKAEKREQVKQNALHREMQPKVVHLEMNSQQGYS